MNYEEAYKFLSEQRADIMSQQAMGRGIYPSKALEAAFVIMPYAHNFNEKRATISGQILAHMVGSGKYSHIQGRLLAEMAIEYTDELMKLLAKEERE